MYYIYHFMFFFLYNQAGLSPLKTPRSINSLCPQFFLSSSIGSHLIVFWMETRIVTLRKKKNLPKSFQSICGPSVRQPPPERPLPGAAHSRTRNRALLWEPRETTGCGFPACPIKTLPLLSLSPGPLTLEGGSSCVLRTPRQPCAEERRPHANSQHRLVSDMRPEIHPLGN